MWGDKQVGIGGTENPDDVFCPSAKADNIPAGWRLHCQDHRGEERERSLCRQMQQNTQALLSTARPLLKLGSIISHLRHCRSFPSGPPASGIAPLKPILHIEFICWLFEELAWPQTVLDVRNTRSLQNVNLIIYFQAQFFQSSLTIFKIKSKFLNLVQNPFVIFPSAYISSFNIHPLLPAIWFLAILDYLYRPWP